MSKHKLVVFLGGAATGKSTLKRILEENGFIRVISHTTREMMHREIPGINYHFINDIIFEIYSREKHLIEETVYNGYRYGIAKHDINLNKGNHVATLDKVGLKKIKEYLGEENVISILIKSDEKEVYKRMQRRSDSITEKGIKERLKYDSVMLEGIEKEVDYIVYNEDNSLKHLMQEISKILLDEKIIKNEIE